MFTLLISLLAKAFIAPPTPPRKRTRWTDRDIKLCMRYEVQAGSDFMETREKMIRVFGPDFMEINEFDRLFSWFKDGNNELDVEPRRKMPEYFKNNEMTFRHCLLYEFLPIKDAEYAYPNFVKAVGDDVISFENFQFWCSRFSEGRFDEDDDKKPISDLETFFQNDKKAVRSCILYEFLKGIQIKKAFVEVGDLVFGRYDSMCSTLGYDVIDYSEFTFWYYRFANGEFDLEDVQMNDDRKAVDFSDLPTNVMKKIVEKLDYCGRSVTRKVCKTFRSIVDEHPVKYEKIQLFPLDSDGLRIDYDGFEVWYAEDGENCKVTHSNRYGATKLKKSNFVDVACNDLAVALKNSDTEVECFDVLILEGFTEDEYLCSELMKSLKFNSKIRVKETTIGIDSFKTILAILNQLEPGKLEKICKESGENVKEEEKEEEIRDVWSTSEFNQLFEMDQFKQAKEVEIFNQLPDIPNLLKHFYHFNCFDINVSTITSEDVAQLVDAVSKSIDFDSCHISFESSIENSVEIGRKLGEIVADELPEDESIIHRRLIRCSTGDVLETTITQDEIIIVRKPE